MKTSASPELVAAAIPPRSRPVFPPLGFVLIGGLAIRIYLSLTSYCISGDGPAYIGMAREFAAGDWRTPLGAVFSPLYPLLLAGMHLVVPDWEIAGNLVSALAGTGAIASVYLLMGEIFASPPIALGAAALVAIHPDLAALSASVRTEAGYIFLTTLAVWLILKATRENSLVLALLAGAIVGFGYLYRTEAIALVVLNAAYPPMASLIWRQGSFSRALGLGLAALLAALVLVLPYIFFLHSATSHWTIGREFNVAIMLGLGGSAPDRAHWQHFAFSAQTAPLAELVNHPTLYLAKVRNDLAISFYNFFQAEGPLLAILLAYGLWGRGREILRTAGETFLVLSIVFYFGGFTLTQTGTRFLIHLIPYTFGWVIVGLTALTVTLREVAARRAWHFPRDLPAALLALILIPQTLWPIGYDMRGARYAGVEIAAHNAGHGAVIARDGRVAWYSGARFIALPTGAVPSLCDWFAVQNNAAYLLIGEHDERQFAIKPTTACLQLLRRYPRYGAGYYDLYAIRGPGVRQ
jgi:hypothetical protein